MRRRSLTGAVGLLILAAAGAYAFVSRGPTYVNPVYVVDPTRRLLVPDVLR